MEKKVFQSYLLLITFAVGLILILMKWDVIFAGVGIFLKLLKPFFIGFAIAFVLNIPYEAIRRAFGKHKHGRMFQAVEKPLALFGAYFVSFGILGGVIAIVIPEFIHSTEQLIENSTVYVQKLQLFLSKMDSSYPPQIADFDLEQLLQRLEEELQGVVEQTMNAMSILFPQIFNVTTNIVQGVINLVIGLIISVYLLSSKEVLCRQGKRICYAFLPKRIAEEATEVVQLITQCFNNFVTGQLLEACILGLLCFIGMQLFGFEYAFLISLLVGVSSVIPVVGAFIGTVPAAFLLFFVEPMQAFWFLVFIVVLQQIEGNLIYPRVVGDSVGLPPLWVLMGIVIGGGLGGIVGMLLGVPLFTVLYKLLSQATRARLQKKNLFL